MNNQERLDNLTKRLHAAAPRHCSICGKLSVGAHGKVTQILYRSICQSCYDKEQEKTEAAIRGQAKVFNMINHFLQ